MKKILPILLVLIGLGGGVMAGHVLKPAPKIDDKAMDAKDEHSEKDAHAEDSHAKDDSHATDDYKDASEEKDPLGGPTQPKDPDVSYEYVKLDQQFVVPVMSETRVAALIVMSLSIEVESGLTQEVFAREPKLRDAFLRVMFEHERAGGFKGVFTATKLMRDLRRSLRKTAQGIVGPAINDVLVTDILRQDL